MNEYKEQNCSSLLLNPNTVAHLQYFPERFVKEKAYREIIVLFLSLGDELEPASHCKIGKSV